MILPLTDGDYSDRLLAPGKEAAWTAAAAQALRNDPAASLEQTTARALAAVHGLAPDAARDIEALLAGRPLDSLSASGDSSNALVRAGVDTYAFRVGGLFHRTSDGWRLVGPEINPSRSFAVDGARLYATDGWKVFEFSAGERREVIDFARGQRQLGPLIRYGGTAYLGVGGHNSVYAERDGRWELVPGGEYIGLPQSAAVHDGSLYFGGSGGGGGALRRFDGKSWSDVLIGAGNVVKMIAHGGHLYVQTRGRESGDRAFEISGREATPLFGGAVVEWLYAHGDRLYAASKTSEAAWEIHERSSGDWTRLLENVGRPGPSIAAAGAELFIQTVDGRFHRGEGGTWTRLGDRGAWLSDAVAHDGKQYMATGDGLAVAGGGRVDVVLPGLFINSMSSSGKELLLSNAMVVKRLMTGWPADWRAALFEAYQAAIPQGAPIPPSAAPLLRDRAGRSLLGFTSPNERD